MPWMEFPSLSRPASSLRCWDPMAPEKPPPSPFSPPPFCQLRDRRSIAGHDVTHSASKVRQNIGIIFQQPSLDGNLSAEENIRFHAVLYGLWPFFPSFSTMPRAYQDRVRELAALLGLEDDMFKPVKKFSGGMRRKLEIIRSLLHRAPRPVPGRTDRRPGPGQAAEVYGNTCGKCAGRAALRSSSPPTIWMRPRKQISICIINQGKIVSYGSPATSQGGVGRTLPADRRREPRTTPV